MEGRNHKMLLSVIAILALVGLGGCQNDQMSQDYTRLMTQNRDLQTALTSERDARLAAENERNTLLAKLQGAPAPAPAGPGAVANTGANTGFSGIEGIETERRGADIHVRIPGDVLFASGKVELKTTAQKTLDQIAAVINRDYAGKAIRVEGYTDSDPIRKSSWADNLELSLQRTAAVHRYLQSKGVDEKRMYAAGFGESKPRGTKSQSRRVEIVVVGTE